MYSWGKNIKLKIQNKSQYFHKTPFKAQKLKKDIKMNILLYCTRKIDVKQDF